MADILIADNDVQVNGLLTSLLQMEGWSVHSVFDGVAALDYLRRRCPRDGDPSDALASPPKLLVCDLDMPEMDGFALVGEVAKLHRPPPVIVVTGFADPLVKEQLEQKGPVRAIWNKPFDLDEFCAAVAAVVEAAAPTASDPAVSDPLASDPAVFGPPKGGPRRAGLWAKRASGGGGDVILDRLSFRTAGESHGPAVVAIVEGLPRGMALDLDHINHSLRRRQGGAGRGGRQRIEDDAVEILGGMRRGVTIGSPLCLLVRNRDDSIDRMPEPTRPRPGHADLSGCYRYLDLDIRGNLERSSARETAGRVAAGAVAQQLLAALGTEVFGFVRSVAGVGLPADSPGSLIRADLPGLREIRDGSRLYTLDPEVDGAMLARVQEAGRRKDTVGGVVEVHGVNPVPGAGSCLQWNERLDARLGAAILSIPAFKGVEVGLGFACADRFGSDVHDGILPATGDDVAVLPRDRNHAGGLEGGMTNGQPVVVRGAMKPISTLRQPLASVDLATGEADTAGYERSDLCAVSAASVVAESMMSLVLADGALRLLGGESLEQVVERGQRHREACDRLGRGRA